MGSFDTVSESRSSVWMAVNCKGCERNKSWLNLEYKPDIFLRVLRKVRKNLS